MSNCVNSSFSSGLTAVLQVAEPTSHFMYTLPVVTNVQFNFSFNSYVLADTTTLTDTIVFYFAVFSTLADAYTATDSVAFSIAKFISEDVFLTDNVSLVNSGGASVGDTLSVAETYAVSVDKILVDSALLSDTVIVSLVDESAPLLNTDPLNIFLLN